MSKSKARFLAELLSSDGKVIKAKSQASTIVVGDLPTIPNSKLQNSSVTIAGEGLSLGASLTLDTGDVTEHTNYKYYTDARAITAVSGSDLDMAGRKVLFGNMYSSTGDLPSASTYHGMFAHVHGTGKGYFAHAGSWVELANQSGLTTATTTANAALPKAGGTLTGNLTVAQNISSASSAPLVLTGDGGANIELYGNGTAFIDATTTTFRGTNGSGHGNISAGQIIGDDLSLEVDGAGSELKFVTGGAFRASLGYSNATGLMILDNKYSSVDIHAGASGTSSIRGRFNSVGLSVTGNIYASSSVYVGNDARLSSDAAGELGVGYGTTATNHRFTVYNNTTPAFRVKPDGNVGIGTPSPDYKLEVVGNTMIGDTSAVTTPGFSARQNIVSSFSQGSNGVGRGGSLYLLNTNTNRESGFLSFGAYYNNTNNKYYQTGGIGGGKEAAAGSGWGGYLSFWTTSDGTAGSASAQFEHMRITADGNVGIGTTNPNRLQYGSIDPKLHVNTDGTSGAYDLVARFQSGPDTDNSGAAILINHSNDRGLLIEAGRQIGDRGIAHFSILNSGATKERILTLKQGGNVGIGTAAPGYLLTVQKDVDAFAVKIENDGNSPGTSGASYADASDGLWVDTRWNTATNTPFKVTSNSGTAPMMIIKGNGNVGIGTDNPNARLDINSTGTAATPNVNITTTNSDAFNHAINAFAPNLTDGEGELIVVGKAGSTKNAGWLGYRYSSAASDNNIISLGHWGNNWLLNVKGNGNVGIGTTSPDYKLEVEGASGTTVAIKTPWAANAYGQYKFATPVGEASMRSRVPGNSTIGLEFYTYGSNNGTAKMSILGDGNVGIGTTAPGASKLKVYNSTVTGNTQLHIHNDKAGDAAVLKLEGKRTSTNDTGQLLFANNGNVVARIDAVSAGDDGELRFFTSVSGTGSTTLERMSISAAGDLIKQGGVIKGERGTAAAPPYSFSDDPDSGMFNIGNTNLGFSVGGVERMRIDGVYGHVTLGAKGALSGTDSASKGGKIAGMRSVNVLDWMQRREVTSLQHGDSAGCTNLYGVAFNMNGPSNNNKWYLGEGPSGALEWLWQGKSVTGSGATGGWDGNTFSVDNNYSYIIINWVKRVSSANTGTYYHGTSSVCDSSGNSLANPYMTIASTGTLPLNVWCVDIQPLHAWHMTSNTAMGQQGLFRTDTGARLQLHSGQFGGGVNAFRLGSSSNQSHNITHRTYLYYAAEGDGTELHWASPAIYRVDGTQPRVSELIKGFGAAAVI